MNLPEIDFDKILEEVKRVEARGPEGFTSFELSDHLGCAQATAARKIRDLVNAGVLRFNGKRQAQNMCGVWHSVPVYTKT